ncbi:hypothetical protein [Corynebacterium appendicis]|uniref:hypothetical protein n=1 Tax=Corynebacterium appendicis TaxID=163202 RepID=UPI0025513650|nr:hypothetical protein [Corynebacterium appendicis]MDK8625461.1 hypothetical protein [Corynebacterium appendicis]
MRFRTAAINANQAEAQNNTLELVRTLNSGIATMDCNSVSTLLRGAKLVDDTTTRSQLTSKLNKQFGADASLTLITAPHHQRRRRPRLGLRHRQGRPRHPEKPGHRVHLEALLPDRSPRTA